MIKVIEQYHDIWGYCPEERRAALQRIERAGRICYKSEDKITHNSCLSFVKKLEDALHWAMIEHSNMVVKLFPQAALESSNFIYKEQTNGKDRKIYAGNYRAFMEALGFKTVIDMLDALSVYQVHGTDIPLWARAVSVLFTTNRAMTHELIRHRPCSFGQLSQRYVDHRNSMEFIKPVRFRNRENTTQYERWVNAMSMIAKVYCEMREDGESPQQARGVLPNDKSTEIVVTAYLPEWEHIFNLRCASSADPQMQALMKPVQDDFKKMGYLEESK